MYPQPGARPAWEVLWRHAQGVLRSHGLPAPRQLSWPGDLAGAWRAPDLLLSQTCAQPYRLWVHHHAEVLGAFDFNLPGCGAGEYASLAIARRGERRGITRLHSEGRIAINAYDSQSGYRAWAVFGALPEVAVVTGSHGASVAAVARGQADVALIDAVSWRYLRRLPGVTPHVLAIAQTPPKPGLPLITARRDLAPRLRTALAEAIATAPAAPMRWLGLRGFVAKRSADYLPATP